MEFILEYVTILLILTGGSSLLRIAGINGWVLPFLGFIAGLSLVVIIGTLQIITPLPTSPILTLAITSILPITALIYKRNDIKIKLFPIFSTVFVLFLLVSFFSYSNLVNWSTDSFFYLESATLIAENHFESVRFSNLIKRLTATPLIHATASLGEQTYLRSVTPLIGIGTIASLVWLFVAGTKDKISLKNVLWFSLLGVLLLVSMNRYVFHSFYINGHLFFAAMLLILAGSNWVMAMRPNIPYKKGMVLLQLLVIPVLVFTRPEAPFLLGTALLPLVASQKFGYKHKVLSLSVFGFSLISWYGYVSFEHIKAGGLPPDSAYLYVGLGLALLLITIFLNLSFIKKHLNKLPPLLELALWIALVAFYMVNPNILNESVYTTAENVFFNEGSWGLSFVLLVISAILLLLLRKYQWQIFIRFPLTTFLPLAFLFAYFRDNNYRIGDGDSLNRMLIQIVPLMVLYVITAASIGVSKKIDCKKHL